MSRSGRWTGRCPIRKRSARPHRCFLCSRFLRTRRGRSGIRHQDAAAFFATGPRPYKDLRQDYFGTKNYDRWSGQIRPPILGRASARDDLFRGWLDRRGRKRTGWHARGSRSRVFTFLTRDRKPSRRPKRPPAPPNPSGPTPSGVGAELAFGHTKFWAGDGWASGIRCERTGRAQRQTSGDRSGDNCCSGSGSRLIRNGATLRARRGPSPTVGRETGSAPCRWRQTMVLMQRDRRAGLIIDGADILGAHRKASFHTGNKEEAPGCH